jgi:hypothetical protein
MENGPARASASPPVRLAAISRRRSARRRRASSCWYLFPVHNGGRRTLAGSPDVRWFGVRTVGGGADGPASGSVTTSDGNTKGSMCGGHHDLQVDEPSTRVHAGFDGPAFHATGCDLIGPAGSFDGSARSLSEAASIRWMTLCAPKVSSLRSLMRTVTSRRGHTCHHP